MTAETRTFTREDDAWLAEQMGCLVIQYKHGPECACPSNEHGKYGRGDHGEQLRGPLKSYCTTPTWETTMGEIVPWMESQGWNWSIDTKFWHGTDIPRPEHLLHVDFWRTDPSDEKHFQRFEVEATTYSPQAIIEAAMKALGR